MKILILLLAFVCLVTGHVNNTQRLIDLGFDVSLFDADTLEDAFLTTPQLARKYGYRAEVHMVTTSDGYILQMHRIRSRLPQSIQNRKAPIFLMHGLQGTSDTWVIAKENALAYLLVNMGYDIWLGNARGNFYSRKHKTLNPDGAKTERNKYWSFSWHEIGIYDLPAMIDKVLEITGYTKLHFIGIFCFWVMASELPKYNDKIIAMHALAPVSYMSNINNVLFRMIAPYVNYVDLVKNKILGFHEIPANSDIILKSGLSKCSNLIGNEKNECVYRSYLSILSYNSPDQINIKLPVFANHIIGGTAIRCFVHYGQLVNSVKFRKYQYGLLNLFTYARFRPPDYNLSNISAPVALYYSSGDDFSSIIDVNKLTQLLPNIIEKYLVKDSTFSHSDFIFSPRIIDLVFKQLFSNLQYAQEQLL